MSAAAEDRSFAVTAPVLRRDDQSFASGVVSCTAKAGTTPLRSTGRAANGSARGSMRIPRNAKGASLRGTMSVSVAGAKPVTQAFSFRTG